MPQTFKALASIMAWAFWITAWLMGFGALVMGLVSNTLFGDEPTPAMIPIFFALALAYGFLSVVLMRLRQKMETG